MFYYCYILVLPPLSFIHVPEPISTVVFLPLFLGIGYRCAFIIFQVVPTRISMDPATSASLSSMATLPPALGHGASSNAVPTISIPPNLLPCTTATGQPPSTTAQVTGRRANSSGNASGSGAAFDAEIPAEPRHVRPRVLALTTTDVGPTTADDARDLIRQVARQQMEQMNVSGFPPVLHHQVPPVIEHHPLAGAPPALPVTAVPAPAPPGCSSLDVLLRSLLPPGGAAAPILPAPAAVDIQGARPVHNDSTSNSFRCCKRYLQTRIAHSLNEAVDHMCTGPRLPRQGSPYIRHLFEYPVITRMYV